MLKALISLLLLAWVLHGIDLNDLWQTLRQIKVLMIPLALALQLASAVVAAYRWRSIMRLLEFKENFLFFCRSYFKGTFFSQVLPTSVGGDLYRIIELCRLGYKKALTFCAVLMDRIYGSLGLVLIAVVFHGVLPHAFPESVNLLIAVVTYGILLAAVMLFFLKRWKRGATIRIFGLAVELSKIFSRSFSSPQDFIWKIVLSILSNALTIGAVYVLARSLHVDAGWPYFFLIVPLVSLLTLVPISLAGWGIREGAMVSLFSFVGVAKAAVLPVSVLYGLLMIVAALPGLYFYLRAK